MCGFEFTHHDVLNDKNDFNSVKRKMNRLLSLKNQEIYIFYHNRYCKDTNTNMLIDDLCQLKKIYEKKNNKVEIIAFTQVLVSSLSDRKVEKSILNDIYFYKIYSLNVWEGSNEDVFWGRVDNDLLELMFLDVKTTFKIKSHNVGPVIYAKKLINKVKKNINKRG